MKLSSDPEPMDSVFILVCAVIPFMIMMDELQQIFGQAKDDDAMNGRINILIKRFGAAERVGNS
jgi:hypothetical protein